MKRLGKARYAQLTVAVSAVLIFALLLGDHAAQAQFGAFGGPRPVTLGGVTGWILAEQAAFYRTLANAIRLAKSDGSALWGLIGISFVYGIFHAAGPGHGKAVISSYLIANEETWRRGVVLSFASAVMQSITAITIVGVAAVLLGATAKLMSDTVRIVEIVSYGLIVAIGARLLWVKGHGFFDALRDLKSESAHADDEPHDHTPSGHGYDYSCHQAHVPHHDVSGQDHPHSSGAHCHGEELDVLPWAHAHGPEPQQLAGPGGWRRGFSAIVAVGLRPCSAAFRLSFVLPVVLLLAGIWSAQSQQAQIPAQDPDTPDPTPQARSMRR
jgi:ABC-type nickel/cobalt efflux system permease component RcnA